jgi:hypothetical protein
VFKNAIDTRCKHEENKKKFKYPTLNWIQCLLSTVNSGVKVKFTSEQATKGQRKRGTTGIALFVL